MLPRIDAKRFNIHDDQRMVLDFLLQEKVLLVQRTTLSWPWPDHFRIVTLPRIDDIEMSLGKFERFLSGYCQLQPRRMLPGLHPVALSVQDTVTEVTE